MQSGHQELVFAVNRIRAHFVHRDGTSKVIVGTGFWVHLPVAHVFVTNRHNLDPLLKLGSECGFRLESVEIEHRRHKADRYGKETRFLPVLNLSEVLLLSDEADVAIIKAPEVFEDFREKWEHGSYFKPLQMIEASDIADGAYLENEVSVADGAFFIGFAGQSGKPWWDTDWNLPIARFCSLASLPRLKFANEAIKMQDAMLVAGLSFAGSSGSPVFAVPKEVGAGGPKVIGIMSGHWWEVSDEPLMFAHSGLSYLTRATAIWDLLNKVY